jgi:hypothetical protein
MLALSESYRVLIASPSDLARERDAATRAVHEWNIQHSAAEGVVLLPVRWETHTRPQWARVRKRGLTSDGAVLRYLNWNVLDQARKCNRCRGIGDR